MKTEQPAGLNPKDTWRGETVDMIEELENYYRRQGIAACEFACKYFEECKGTCQHFTQARAAYVGPDYGMEGYPRLVILSLDPGYGDDECLHRTLKGVLAGGLAYGVPETKQGHWRPTIELAHKILAPFHAGENFSLDDALRSFAHTNSAKCCENRGGKMAHHRLFRNCREYIPEELKILAPNILYTQGNPAFASVNGVFPILRTERRKKGNTNCEYNIIQLKEGHETFWFHTYHPRHGSFKTQKDNCGQYYAEGAHRFLSGALDVRG